jgi:hypothetical protein
MRHAYCVARKLVDGSSRWNVGAVLGRREQNYWKPTAWIQEDPLNKLFNRGVSCHRDWLVLDRLTTLEPTECC